MKKKGISISSISVLSYTNHNVSFCHSDITENFNPGKKVKFLRIYAKFTNLISEIYKKIKDEEIWKRKWENYFWILNFSFIMSCVAPPENALILFTLIHHSRRVLSHLSYTDLAYEAVVLWIYQSLWCATSRPLHTTTVFMWAQALVGEPLHERTSNPDVLGVAVKYKCQEIKKFNITFDNLIY